MSSIPSQEPSTLPFKATVQEKLPSPGRCSHFPYSLGPTSKRRNESAESPNISVLFPWSFRFQGPAQVNSERIHINLQDGEQPPSCVKPALAPTLWGPLHCPSTHHPFTCQWLPTGGSTCNSFPEDFDRSIWPQTRSAGAPKSSHRPITELSLSAPQREHSTVSQRSQDRLITNCP